MLNHDFYSKQGDKIVCEICPNFCKMSEGQEGICFGRMNKNGTLVPSNYGKVAAVAVDPIEKKPLYHFLPGEEILSIGTYGCNFRCIFCQNYDISQGKVFTQTYTPETLVEIAKKRHSFGISYTYNEPIIWYEFVLDCMKLCREEGLCNILVSNGFINEKPLMKLLPYIDGINIDLKSIRDEFYTKYVKGKLEPVKKTIKMCFKESIVEVTNLLITDLNDSETEMEELTDWVAGVSEDLPLHISRYFPRHKLRNPATSLEKLERFYQIAKKKLKFVYIGNAYIKDTSDTYCPECNSRLVSRNGYSIKNTGLTEDGKCKNCGASIYGKFN